MIVTLISEAERLSVTSADPVLSRLPSRVCTDTSDGTSSTSATIVSSAAISKTLLWSSKTELSGLAAGMELVNAIDAFIGPAANVSIRPVAWATTTSGATGAFE